MRAFALGAVLLAGCYRPAPAAGTPCSDRGTCPAPLSCVGNVCIDPDNPPGDAAIDACPDVSCVGNDLAGCGARFTCSLGCADAAATTPAHCRVMVPSNGITEALLAGATADVTGLDLDFDTDTGEVTFDSGMPLRAPGVGVNAGIGFQIVDKMAVFTAHSWTVPAFVNGSGDDWDAGGANALVLYSATTIRVDGRIDVGAAGTGGGPGGASGATTGSPGPFCRGKAGLWQMAGYGEGGGGAGGRAAGGDGARSNTTTFGTGGPMCALPSTIPLAGGNGGGAGGVETAASPDVVHGGDGGGGGGALALVAMESITFSATGNVCAPGEGGRTSVTGDGGGGGGSGGAILLESPVITLTAASAVTANGGGGAAPNTNNGTRGHVDDGGQATGGVFMAASGGKGGSGAAPTNGTNFTDATTARGGGGGGAGGRIELKARTRVTMGAIVSPGTALSDITTK